MTWISYSSNFEDVLLRRCFGHIKRGFYIDVGASNARHCSNTYALYELGWSGVVIDPLLTGDCEAEWLDKRYRDHLYPLAVGAENGVLDFWRERTYLQASTGSKDMIEHYRQSGAHISEPSERVRITTLTAILDTIPWADTIHLLDIDVEGMELDVLQGLDFARYRPWLILFESTLAGSGLSHLRLAEIRQRLLNWDYSLVYRDGANDWYAAVEHFELARHFEVPPNPFDGFKPYVQVLLEERIKELENAR